MTIKDEWLEYVNNQDSFDDYHFEGLFLELEAESDLIEAFSGLPNGSEFSARISKFRHEADFNGTYLLARKTEINRTTYNYAEIYKNSVSDRLRELGDSDADIIYRSDITEISYEKYREMKQQSRLGLLNATMSLSSDFTDYCAKLPNWIWGLKEAVYMMTTIPEVTRYLLWPIVKYPLDDEPAAKLWLMGHRMDFCADRTLLIIGGAD